MKHAIVKKYFPLLSLVFITAAIFITYVLAKQIQDLRQRAAGNVSVEILSGGSNSLHATVGQAYDAAVNYKLNGTPILGADLTFRFDPQIIQVDSLELASGLDVLENTIDNTAGTARFQFGVSSFSPITTDGSFGTLKFHAIAKGGTSLNIAPAPTSVIIGTTAGKNVLGSAYTLSVFVFTQNYTKLTFSPAEKTVAPGESFVIDVQLSSLANTVADAAVDFRFPTGFTIDSVEAGPVMPVMLSGLTQNELIPGLMKGYFEVGVSQQSGGFKGEGVIARIHVTAGNLIGFNSFEVGSTTQVISIDGQNVLEESLGSTINVSLSPSIAPSTTPKPTSQVISLLPDALTVGTGQTFTIQMQLNTQSSNAVGVNAKIRFPSQLFTVGQVSGGTSMPKLLTSSVTTIDSSTKELAFAVAVLPANGAFYGTGIIANIPFTALSVGSANLNVTTDTEIIDSQGSSVGFVRFPSSIIIGQGGPTPTPSGIGGGSCQSTCTVSGDCASGLECLPAGINGEKICVNSQCTNSIDCLCSVQNPSPSPSPSGINPGACQGSCSIDANCRFGLLCLPVGAGGANVCANPQCTSAVDCLCGVTFPSPTPTANPSPTASPASSPSMSPSSSTSTGVNVAFSLKFEGVTKLMGDKNVFIQFTKEGDSFPVVQGVKSFVGSSTGLYTMADFFPQIMPGNYYISVKGPAHLRKIYIVEIHDVAQETVNLTEIRSPEYVYAGDVNGDNVVDQYDINEFLQAYPNNSAMDNNDFTFDDILDIYDFAYFQAHYEEVGE